MSLQYKFFTILVNDSGEAEAELNRFLRSVRVLALKLEFVVNDVNSFWSLAVEYLPSLDQSAATEKSKTGKNRIDYKEALSPEDFAVFAKLREWRKETAGQEAVPVYTIFSNEQLAQIASKRYTTKSGLREIEGVGDARIEKYGDAVIQIVSEHVNPNQKDSA